MSISKPSYTRKQVLQALRGSLIETPDDFWQRGFSSGVLAVADKLGLEDRLPLVEPPTPARKTCPECGGSGGDLIVPTDVCPECRGEGTVEMGRPGGL